MPDYILWLYVDALTDKSTLFASLPTGNRATYVVGGTVTISDPGTNPG